MKEGDYYERVKGKWEGEFSEYKTCLICAKIREDFLCSWAYGYLRDDLWNCLEVELI